MGLQLLLMLRFLRANSAVFFSDVTRVRVLFVYFTAIAAAAAVAAIVCLASS